MERKNFGGVAVVRAALCATVLVLAPGLVQGQVEPEYVVAVNVGTLYLYREDGSDMGKIKGKKVSSQFVPINAGDFSKGLPVESINHEEGLIEIRIEYEKTNQSVWIESMAVKTYPDNQLACPKTVLARSDEVKKGATIGFGTHCK